MMTRSEKGKILENELIKKDKIEKKKKLKKFLIKFIIIFIILFILLLVYMHFVGTKGLQVREYKVEEENIPDSFHGFKIVHFSDLHYLTTINKKEVKNIVNEINNLNPDIVVFTGDLLDSKHKLTDNDIKTLSNELKKIKATTGLYAIKGNHDYQKNTFEKVFNNTNFKILNNDYELIYYKGITPILLNGVGSILKNDCDYNKAFSYNEVDNPYTITLLHEPDVIDSITAKYNVNLVLAGHTHNGQVRIPFIGPIMKVNEGKKYSNSYYKINNTKLYISGGLGTSMYEFRWFNRPSINVYRLMKKAS